MLLPQPCPSRFPIYPNLRDTVLSPVSNQETKTGNKSIVTRYSILCVSVCPPTCSRKPRFFIIPREGYCLPLGAGGSRMWVWSSAASTWPGPSCIQMTASDTQGSSRISDMVARSFGSIVSMRPMMCLLSRGSNLSKRHGPRMTSF